MTYTHYQIKDNEVFDCNNYPALVEELKKIKKATVNVSDTFKREILVSYTKSHCLRLEWLKENSEFSDLVSSGALPITTMESLFAASYYNSSFTCQLEEYIKETLS